VPSYRQLHWAAADLVGGGAPLGARIVSLLLRGMSIRGASVGMKRHPSFDVQAGWKAPHRRHTGAVNAQQARAGAHGTSLPPTGTEWGLLPHTNSNAAEYGWKDMS
jgi:hypothetical protein